MTGPDGPTGREVARAAAPGVWADATSAILQTLGADPIVSAMIGSTVGFAYALDQAARERRERRVGQLVEAVGSHLGGPQEFADRALATDETAELTRRVLEAAARATLPEKLTALGRVLANALDGTETIDTALLIASALQDLEAPHVRALRVIEDLDTLRPPAGGGWATKTPGVSVQEMRRGLRGQDGALEAVVGALTLHGLVRDVTAGGGGYGAGGARYAVTDLAGQVLDLLSDHAPAD